MRTAERRGGRTVAAVLVGLAAVVVGATGPSAAAPPDTLQDWETAVVDLPNGGIASDPVRGTVLVAVAPSVPGLGNHLVELDPRTGALGRSVPVGSDPRAVAVADDGSRAYVGGHGSSIVTEVDLATFEVVREIPLGNEGHAGPIFVGDLEVQPGHPGVIAVSLTNRATHHGVVIIDEGVRRPTTTASSRIEINRITWGDDPTTLYGYNNRTSGFELSVLEVDVEGVTATSPGDPIQGFNHDIEQVGDTVVATNGQVVDVETLTLAGRYANGGVIEADEAAGTTYLLTGSTLTSHETSTLLPLDSRTVPAILPKSMVDVGPALVAAGPSQLLLVGDDVSASGFVLPPAPESRLAPTGDLSVALQVDELAAAPDGAHVYGVVPQTAGQLPGRLVEIATATGEVTRSLFVGGGAHQLAVSADGSTVLVGHRDANRLTEVEVSDLSVRRTIPLAVDEVGGDIAARPGTSASFAVVLVTPGSWPALEGQVLVQDGTILPRRGPGHSGATTVAFGSDPGVLYGINTASTAYGLHILRVDETGLTPLGEVTRMSPGGGGIVVSEGLVRSTEGWVIDPEVPALIGRAPGGEQVPVPAADRLFVAESSTLHEIELDALTPVATRSLPGRNVRDAVAVGTRLAIATDAGEVLLVPLVIAPPEVSAATPATGPTEGGTAVTITGTGLRGVTSVRFGSTPARSFAVVSDTEVTAVAPSGGAGPVDVTVAGPGGSSTPSTAARFTYVRSAHQSWVWAAHRDFLDREPTPEEVAAAVARLDAGVPRSTLARELAESDEWIEQLVTALYTETLGRTPFASEVAWWAEELRSGRRTVARVAASFYASQEYIDGIGGGTTSSWVRDLYAKLLGRAPSEADVAYWSGRVASRGRGWVALRMFDSLESRRTRVSALYVALLGRAPDTVGRDHWAGRLTAEGDLALARHLAASAEYLARAGRRYP